MKDPATAGAGAGSTRLGQGDSGVSPAQPKPARRSLYVRTAILTWLTILMSFGIFVLALIPYQRAALFEELSSKGEDMATSVGQAVATALLLEDYASIVDHCMLVVRERPSILYVVVTKKDGSSLIHTVENWEQENLTGMWLPSTASPPPPGRLLQSELTGGQVFHYTFPFRQSGLDWGWIHIGLAVDQFHANLAAMYRHTVLAALLCLALGLGASIFFAKRLSGPILELDRAARRVGDGDFSARAGIVSSGDELERLAQTFNWMAHSLDRSQREIIAAWGYADQVIHSIRDCLIVLQPDGTIETANAAATELLGYDEASLVHQPITAFLADFPTRGEKDFLSVFVESPAVNVEVGYQRKDGAVVPVLVSGAAMRNEAGDVFGFVTIAKDISNRKEAEERMKRSLKEKELLLREIHHRVKNNMQIISSLLKLQGPQVTDPDARNVLVESQNRIRSMSLLHERLYHSEDLTNVDFEEYVKSLAKGLYQSYILSPERVSLQVKASSITLGIDRAIPCGLIVSELLSNALKHAFHDQERGEIAVDLARTDGGHLELVVSDNGCGLGEDFSPMDAETLGLRLVVMLAEDQLDGTITFEGTGGGTKARIKFPEEVR